LPATRAVTSVEGAQLLWCDVLRQVGWETEDALDRALNSLDGALRQGRLKAADLDDIRTVLRRLKGVGSASQQIAGVAEGSLYGLTRCIALAPLVQALVGERAEEFRRRRSSCIRHLRDVSVIADDNLLRVFIQAVIAWSLERSSGDVELSLEPAAQAGRARLLCRFRHRTDMRRRSRFGGPANWGASWQLVLQAAQALGWEMRSGDAERDTWMSVDFDCVGPMTTLPPMEAIELDGAEAAAQLDALQHAA
jgi:hypothetical protein